MQRCASVIWALSTDTAACRRLNAALLGANPGGQRLEQVICSGKTTATGVQMQVTSLPISAVNQMLGVSVRFAKNIVITQNQMFDLSSEGIWIEQDDDPTALDWQDTITGFEISYNSLVNLGTSTTSVPRVIVLNTSGMRQLSDGGV